MQWRAISSTSEGGLAIDAGNDLAGQNQRAPAPKRMFVPSFQAFAHNARLWISLELFRMGERLNDIRSLRLPVFGEVTDTPDAVEHPVPDERIAPTAIVLFGLGEVIFVAFLVGHTYDVLHPVWRGIVALAACGVAFYSFRLARLLRRNSGR